VTNFDFAWILQGACGIAVAVLMRVGYRPSARSFALSERHAC